MEVCVIMCGVEGAELVCGLETGRVLRIGYHRHAGSIPDQVSVARKSGVFFCSALL